MNRHYTVCATYPTVYASVLSVSLPLTSCSSLVAPLVLDDAHMARVAAFRSSHRLPAVVWRHAQTRAVLVRCSQPLPGLLQQRASADELCLSSLPLSHSIPP